MPRRTSLSDSATPSKPARGFGTRSVHPPEPPAQAGAPVTPALDTSATYSFSDIEAFARASREKVGGGYVYTRWANPTIDRFEAAVADLEGAEGAEAFATGMAAISSTLLALCSGGDRIVSTRQLYGGTHSLFGQILPRYGISIDLVDVDGHDEIERTLEGASVLYCETIGNPRMQVADLPALAKLAETAGATLVVDNTFASPLVCRPLEHGAHVSVHSATKFLGGHHDLMGGVVCASESLLEPIRELGRDLGATLAPFNAWLALRGMKTLHLRVDRACSSASEIARALKEHSDVSSVHYPALEGDPGRPLADLLLDGRGGGTLAFDVLGGRERAARFQSALRLIEPAASLGGTHSLITHAASVTHTQLGPEELQAAGISEGFCRLAVGLEDAHDLIDDLFQALESSK